MPRLPYRKGFQPLYGRTPRLRLDHLRQVTRRELLRLRIKCLPVGSAAVHLGLALRRRQQAPREIVCMRLLLPNGGRWIARLRRAVTLCAEKPKKQGRTLFD